MSVGKVLLVSSNNDIPSSWMKIGEKLLNKINKIMKTIHLSEKVIKDLLNKLSEIISDNSLDKSYTKERIILSVKGFKFDIDLNDKKKYNIKVEQIIHKLKK